MRVQRIAIGAVTAGLMAVAAVPAAAIQANPPAGGRPQLDVRSDERASVPERVRDARRALVQRLGIEAHAATDPVGGGIRVLHRTDGFLSGPRAGDAADVALAWVRVQADVLGLSDGDLAALRLTDRTTSIDGVTHLTWTPFSAGLPAYDAELRVHVTREGHVIAASGPPLGGLTIASAAPRLTASEALAVAQADVGAAAAIPRAETQQGPQRVTTFANGVRARLVAFEAPDGDRLAWQLTVAGRDPHVYDVVVDAASGELLARKSLTDFVSNASVFDNHPGAASGGTARTADIGPWLSPLATTLRGPNAHAYADVNDNDLAGAGEEVGPSGGSDWSYPVTFFTGVCQFCTWNGSDLASEATNRRHATTQLFYLVNTFHDWLAQPDIGFTSGDGNFEGLDPVQAEADDAVLAASPSFNNANMTTFPDGFSPRMQMYLFRGAFPDVNGSHDASIVYHEYAHGLSNRLVGDAGGLSQNQGAAMGEGWSDWYAMDFLVANGFAADTGAHGEVAVGEYATGDPVRGIRTQPLDCPVGSVAPACGGTTTAGSGGYTFADLGRVGAWNASTPSFEVHDDGEIWAETLWDLRTALGAPTARRLVTQAMRLSPVEPTFLDERDAILLADQTLEGGVHHDAIWQVFANRGMGYGARTTGPNATRGLASFTTPGLAATAGASAVDPAPGGDGDGAIEPGERIRVSVSLVNPGRVALTNAHATLASPTPGVAVLAAGAGYGTIAPGATAAGSAPFELALPRSLVCGDRVVLTLHVTSDQGSADLPVLLSSGAGRAAFGSVDVPKTIVDDAPTSVSAVSTLSVPSDGLIDHLTVTIDATHAYVGDLRARLTAPSGRTVDLLERPGLSGDGSGAARTWNGPLTFDDDAATPIQQIASSGGTLSGAYAPDEPLAALVGQHSAGTWTLRMTDEAELDGGTLHGWSIETEQPRCLTFAIASTGAASDVTRESATLHGSVDPGGLPINGAFQYGRTAGYGEQLVFPGPDSAASQADFSAAVAGLSPATTHHFRMVALSGGAAVAFGEDRTFTTAASLPPATSVAGKRRIAAPTRVTRRARLDARGRFVYAFRAAAGLRGSVRFTIPRHGRTKAIAFGRRAFRVPASGRVRLRIAVRGRALAQLRARHRVAVRATIRLGDATFVRRLTLTAPRPRR